MRREAAEPPSELAILETCLYVDDLDAATRFYAHVMGLELISRRDDRHLFLRLGESMLLLFLPEASSEATSELPTHGTQGAGHIAFHVPPQRLDDWRRRLEECQVPIEQVVDWPNGARSLYFRDPAGNSLELASRGLWFSVE